MYLGVDLGTSNVKAVVLAEDGRVVAAGSKPVERCCRPDGGVEQDIEELWNAACAAIGQAVDGTRGPAIRAVGVSSQGGAMQMLDGQDRPLGRVISWLDARGRPFDLLLTEELGADFLAAHVGHGTSALTLGQVLRLRHESPEIVRLPNRLGFVGDVVVGRLCGRRAHDPTSLGIAMLYNPWLGRADPDILARIEIDPGQLPDLLPATTPAGGLCRQASQLLGLRPGIPVSPAVHDQYAASLGAGSVGEGDVNFGAGTAWVLLANTSRLGLPVTPAALVCQHPVPGLYGQMLSMVNGGSAIQWMMETLGRRQPSTRHVDEMLGGAPPLSGGLCFWPLLSVGAEAPSGFPASGRLDGVTLHHTPNHLLRAVVEGLACELARHLGFLVAAGFSASRLSMCGSAAASRGTPQIIADVLNLPVACVAVSDVSAHGAAVIARALAEPGADLAVLARAWAPASRTVLPGDHAPAYQGLLQKYLAAFRNQVP